MISASFFTARMNFNTRSGTVFIQYLNPFTVFTNRGSSCCGLSMIDWVSKIEDLRPVRTSRYFPYSTSFHTGGFTNLGMVPFLFSGQVAARLMQACEFDIDIDFGFFR